MLKAVLYYPNAKDLLNFSEDKFKLIFEQFPQIKFIYANSANQFESEIIDADYALVSSISTELYYKAKNLKALFTYYAGKETIANIAIANLRCYFGHFHGQLMAESLLGAILFFNQQFPQILESQKNKLWHPRGFSQRSSLSGQSIAIIGYGAIGSHCAQLLSNLGMNVYAVQRRFKQGQCSISGAKYVNVKDIDVLLHTFDHVVSILPYSEDTVNYFNKDFFKKLSAKSYFYNLGRGHAVNEKDLIDALNNKTIAGAMLDVFSSEPLSETSELWDTKNLLITPHISAFYSSYIDLYLNELINQINNELSEI